MIFMILSDGTTETPHALFTLSVWDKLGILGLTAIFFAVVILCLICALSPFCWLYRYCPFQYEPVPTKGVPLQVTYGTADGPRSYEKFADNRSRFVSIKEVESSELSDSSGTNIIELKKLNYKNSLKSLQSGNFTNGSISGSGSQLQAGEIEFSLKYDKSAAQLTINVLQVSNLVVEKVETILAPYVRIRLYHSPKQMFSLGHVINNLDTEFRTKLQKTSHTPTFNETFATRIEPSEVKLYTIKLQLCDLDRFSRRVVIGEYTAPLKKMHLHDKEEKNFTEKLCLPVEEQVGDICVGLHYLPTAEKLNVTVMKMKRLRVMDIQHNTTDSYAKVTLMQDGRPLKKIKTNIRRGELNPEFDETVSFDIPKQDIAQVYICITAVHANKEVSEHRPIGRVYLGYNFDPIAQDHWTEMIQNPRRQVTCWHKLCC